MEKRNGFVKGENNLAEENHSNRFKSRLPSGLMILATLATLSPWNNVKAEKPDSYIPPHPLRQTGRLQPTKQESTLVIPEKEQSPMTTQESTESYHIEETDPFSQQGKLENFVAGYALMNKEEQKEIENRVITTDSGVTIFFSKQTFDRIKTPTNQPLGMRDQSFVTIALPTHNEENNPLESYIKKIPTLTDVSLGEESFVVVDDDGKNQNIIMWSIGPDGVRERAKLLGIRNYRVSCVTSLYHDGQLLSLPTPTLLISNPPVKGFLSPFAVRPSWENKKNRLVYADEVSIYADFNLNELDPQTKTVKSIIRETPTLLGDVHSRLKANLKRYLKLTEPWKPVTVFFTHPEEIRQYIKTGDPTCLFHIKLLPDEKNPVFFAPLSGSFGLKNPNIMIMNVLEKAVQTLQGIDPALLTIFNQWGKYVFIPPGGGDFVGSVRIYEYYDLPSPNELTQDHFFSKIGLQLIPEQAIQDAKNSILTIMLMKGYMDHFIYNIVMQRELSDFHIQYNGACDVRAKLFETSEFLKRFAQKYQPHMDAKLYDKLIDEADNLFKGVQLMLNRK